jgi:hypothetical protein
MLNVYPWERMRSRMQASVSLAEVSFTPEEFAKLAALRTHLQTRAVDIELDLDERRLTFARWLVEHGRLTDDIQPS